MKRLSRAYFGLLLALTAALAAHGAAAAQGGGMAAQQMVICTGNGAVTLYVDSEGRQVPPPHPCPDCVMQPLDALAVYPAQLALWRRSATPAGSGAQPVLPRSRARLSVRARAPPAMV
ncbi:hypothetical protein [Cribrihabitans neustonicus]|uniref:hypothetical protein n=1 Tax=Cribrihabitans neustonicus TaxID=1429085 RepID=UPI003B5AA9A4